MGNAILSPAGTMFAVMLVIMIIVCLLFGFIMYIALRPIHKDVPAETTTDKLRRREAEIASKLLGKQTDSQETAQLMEQLREVNTAQNIVKSMEPVEEKPAAKPAKKSGRPAPKKPSAPSKPASGVSAKPEAAKAAPKAAAPNAEQAKAVKPEPEVKTK